MKRRTIAFSNGNRARAVYVPADADGAAIAAALGLSRPRALLLLSGGASDMSPAGMDRLRGLIESVARVAAEEGITVMGGGTQAGVMQMMGEGRAAAGGSAPLIGVCPAALVTWSGGPQGEGHVPLEPNHTHFVLTGGDHWGAGTEIMFALAAALSEGAPSVAVLANGGPIARDEVLHNVRQGREIIVIRGSGRLADEIAAAVGGGVKPPDDEVAPIVRNGRIALFDIADGPEALAALLRQKLFGGSELVVKHNFRNLVLAAQSSLDFWDNPIDDEVWNMDMAGLEALLEEATVDCYGEDEEFWGVLYTLDSRLSFPLQARVLGETVTLVGLDDERSGLRRGVMARVHKGDVEYTVALSELEILDPDPVSAEWLAAYRYWLG